MTIKGYSSFNCKVCNAVRSIETRKMTKKEIGDFEVTFGKCTICKTPFAIGRQTTSVLHIDTNIASKGKKDTPVLAKILEVHNRVGASGEYIDFDLKCPNCNTVQERSSQESISQLSMDGKRHRHLRCWKCNKILEIVGESEDVK